MEKIDKADSNNKTCDGVTKTEKENENKDTKLTVYKLSTPSARRYLMVKTISLTYVYICFGIVYGLTGPTQLDLRDNLEGNVTMEQMGITMSFRSLGGLCASVVSGLVLDRYEKSVDLVLCLGLALLAVMLLIKPWVRYLYVLCIVMFFEGAGLSIENITVNTCIVRMFGPDCDTPMQITHVGYAFGFFLAPILAAPFLATRDGDDDDETLFHSSSTSNPYSLSVTDVVYNYTAVDENDSRVHIPYTIAGILTAIASLVILLYLVVKPPKSLKLFVLPKPKMSQVFSLEATGVDSRCYAVVIISSVFLFYFLLLARDIPIQMYTYSYAVESDLAFSSQEAAALDATVKACYVLGRVIASVASQ